MRKIFSACSAILSFLLASLTVFPFVQNTAVAALPKLETIRVALFIDAGIGYRNTVPTVTLSSGKGLKLGVRNPDGFRHWLTHGPTVRFSLDRYMLKLLETSDLNTAIALYNIMANTSYKAYLFSEKLKGKPVYKVYAGSFANEDEAREALQKLKADASFSQAAKGLTPGIAGPLHWNAGTYSSKEEAIQRKQALNEKGLEAFLVYHEDAQSKLVYSVWVGEESDADGLQKVKELTESLFPGIQLKSVDTAKLQYLLQREDLSLGSAGESVPHFFFSPSYQKVWVEPVKEGIKVDERHGRIYRGQLELSQWNEKMAVINQVPFESYLYSVVSSELGQSWPMEALKAQAVAARTYALQAGMKYQIAHVSDSTYDQVYKGMTVEFPEAVQAVDETRGEVLVNDEGLIAAFYFSNAGGMTADPSEIWGNPIDYVQSVPSPDEGAMEGLPFWYRIELSDGTLAYIHGDYVKETGQFTETGLPYVRVTEDRVNVRPAPYVDNINNAPITQVNAGDQFVALEKTVQSNPYFWIRGPYESLRVLEWINPRLNEPISGELKTLEVTRRGPSGRVLEIQANGKVLNVSSPDAYRTVFNSLPSTRFEIEETGRVFIQSADTVRDQVETAELAVLDSSGKTQSISQEMVYAIDGDGKWRPVTKKPQYRFIGYGFGHGIGLSQWGAKGLAELGYDYRQILQYYFKDVRLIKD